MTLKVHQLAKEMGITSKELTQKAQDIGIPVKNHMSSLSESDVERLKGDHQDIKVREERKENGSDSKVYK